MVIGQEGVAARTCPLDRARERLGSQHGHEIFRIWRAAYAETAADVLDDQVDALGWKTGDLLDVAAHTDESLGRSMQRVAVARRIVGRHAGARLHRIADEALAVDAKFGDVARARERRIDRRRVAMLVDIGKIAFDILVHAGRARRDGVGVARDRRRLLVIDDDQLGRILSRGGRIGHHKGYRLADISDAVFGKHRVEGLFHRLAVAVLGGDAADDGLVAGALRVGVGQDRLNARCCKRGGKVEAADGGSGVRRAQHRRVQLLGPVPVGGITPLALDQAQVFSSCRLHGGRGGEIVWM